MIEADVCILGGGAIGSAAAYWLTKTSNLKILILERYSLGNDYCASNDANRVFRYAYGKDAYYTRMAVESLELWRGLEEEAGEKLLISTGLVLLEGEDPESNRFNQESYNTLREMRLRPSILDEAELKERFPQFVAKGAILDRNGGVLLASKVLARFHLLAKARGAKILDRTEATRLRFRSAIEVETATGETVRSGKVIIAAGYWSNKIIGQRLPQVTPTRQQVVYFLPRVIDRFRPEKFPVFFAEQYYGTPAAGIDGVKISHKGLWDPVDPDGLNRSVDLEAVQASRRLCRRFVPEVADGEVAHTKVCVYDMTENSDFIIGRDPEHSDVVYGYGFSGHGFKFAPLAGKLLAELALDKTVSFDISRLAPRLTDPKGYVEC